MGNEFPENKHDNDVNICAGYLSPAFPCTAHRKAGEGKAPGFHPR
jgi:hypothetical protein